MARAGVVGDRVQLAASRAASRVLGVLGVLLLGVLLLRVLLGVPTRVPTRVPEVAMPRMTVVRVARLRGKLVLHLHLLHLLRLLLLRLLRLLCLRLLRLVPGMTGMARVLSKMVLVHGRVARVARVAWVALPWVHAGVALVHRLAHAVARHRLLAPLHIADACRVPRHGRHVQEMAGGPACG